MGIFSRSEIVNTIRILKNAYDSGATSVRYSIGGRAVEHHSLAEIRTELRYWRGELEKIDGVTDNGKVRCRRIIFHG